MAGGRRLILIIVAVALAAVLVAGAIWVLLAVREPGSDPSAQDPGGGTDVTWAPPADPPEAAIEPGSGVAELVDSAWLRRTSERTGIPIRALAAYAGAALAKASSFAECRLSWTTLAGIGAVESDHGRHGGSRIAADGAATPPIFGIALDGGETADIPDSDGGTLDGDTESDRAVGPMQLIPQTWRNWHTDGDGDGVEDPQDIDDAVMAAANYLCRASSPQDTEAGWRSAVMAYNSAPSYVGLVARFAVAYAR